MPKEIKKQVRLDKISYYETHLALINCVFPVHLRLTPTEMQVLAKFMSLEGDIAQYRFGPSARKIIREEFKISISGLANYMRAFFKKGCIIKKGDLIQINPLFNLNPDSQLYMFKLINVDETQTPSINLNGNHQILDNAGNVGQV